MRDFSEGFLVQYFFAFQLGIAKPNVSLEPTNSELLMPAVVLASLSDTLDLSTAAAGPAPAGVAALKTGSYTAEGPMLIGAALTEARSCANQHVVIIGGANSAGQAAVHFSGFAEKVTMLVRGDSLERSMSHYLIEQIAGTPNIEVRTQTRATAAEGDGRLQRLQQLTHFLRLVHEHFQHVDLIGTRKVFLRLLERHEDHRLVVFGHAEFEDGGDLIALDPRRDAERRRALA